MSVFSDLLNQFIKEKKIKIYSLAAACQMDRSMLYRILNGKRNAPSPETFLRICEYLQLAPSELEQLQNAYNLTRAGASLYYKRKSVEEFFLSFPSHLSAGNIKPLLHDAPFSPELPETKNACIPLFSKAEIDYYMHGIFLLESAKEKGSIQLFWQPDCPFLFSTLSSLRLSRPMSISHVICFSKNDQFTAQRHLYNLEYLETMLPLFFADMDYHPYYFYDDIAAHYQNFNGFSCMVLTSDYAIVSTSDYQKGFLYKGASYLQLLRDLYLSYQEKCKPLFHVIDYLTMDGSLQQMYRISPSYVLQPEACLMPLVHDELLEKAIYPQIPDRDGLIRQVSLLLKSNRELLEPEKFIIYFTIPGLKQFLSTGRIHEVPEELYQPLTFAQRKELLESMLPYCESGVYHLLKSPLNQLTANLHIVVNHTMGYLLFKDFRGQILCLVFNEPSLLDTFMDYMEYLKEEGIYSGEETARLVRELLEDTV